MLQKTVSWREENYELYLLTLCENRSFMEKNGCRMQYYPLVSCYYDIQTVVEMKKKIVIMMVLLLAVVGAKAQEVEDMLTIAWGWG